MSSEDVRRSPSDRFKMDFADAAGSGPHSDDPVVLVAGANEKYALGLTVALWSALRNLDKARWAHVFVLDGGFTAETRDRIFRSLRSANGKAAIAFVDCDSQEFLELNDQGYSHAAFLRLKIPQIITNRHSRVLYLDSDVVVLGDVSELWALPDRGWAFWAGMDNGIEGTGWMRDPEVYAGVPVERPVFNSGVMLIEMSEWRRSRISERALRLLELHSDRCITADQDALNAVAWGEWGKLPPQWNYQVRGLKTLSRIDGGARKAEIVHYLDHKPWDPGSSCAYQHEFDAALFASGWFGLAGKIAYTAEHTAGRIKRRMLRNRVVKAGRRYAKRIARV